jgi:indolepyruvate ferredoxin oxidoreductase alpha subunit
VHAPVVEPSSPEEARQITSWAFEVSQSVSLPVMVRLVTRICHARGVVQLGEEPQDTSIPRFPPDRQHFSAGVWHQRTHDRLASLQEIYDRAPFNRYMGPANPELTIFCSGVSFFYAQEAVDRLNLADRVGILKIGTVWPLPRRLVLDRLSTTAKVLFIEEFEPFLEDQTRILAAQFGTQVGPTEYMGRDSGFVPYVMKTRGMGEMDPDIATDALARAMEVKHRTTSPGFTAKLEALPEMELPPRPPALCAGCPHRASFWEIKTALSLDERDGFILGDIGCYALGRGATGFFSVRTVFAMGSGLGLASGMGKLAELGMQQPAVAIVGDSTFFHAGIPPLINAKMNQSNVLAIVLDNSTTAMTGHQPHPGSGRNAMGEASKAISLEALVEGLGIEVTVADPHQVDRTVKTIEELLQQTGPRVLILRRGCALLEAKELKRRQVRVDQQRCLGSECGCNRLCMRVFSCPGNIWDDEADKALIDDVACVGCGVCAQLCPQGAILVEDSEEADHGA